MPRDRTPTVQVDVGSGLASAGGYTGDGVVLSFVAAQALADLLTAPSVATRHTTLPFVNRSSRRWEIEPLRWLGINAGLSLANVADGSERRHGREGRSSRLLDRIMDSGADSPNSHS